MANTKKSIDDRKFELEKRILDTLAERTKSGFRRISGYLDNHQEFVVIPRHELYRVTQASEFGHAGIFNGVVSELNKTGLIRADYQTVVLNAEDIEKAAKEVLDEMALSPEEKLNTSRFPASQAIANIKHKRNASTVS